MQRAAVERRNAPDYLYLEYGDSDEPGRYCWGAGWDEEEEKEEEGVEYRCAHRPSCSRPRRRITFSQPLPSARGSDRFLIIRRYGTP